MLFVNFLRNMKRRPWYYLVISAASFLMVMICLGFCSSTKSLYLNAITDALQIKRSLFSFNDSARFVTTAVVNLFFGTLVLKFGPRKLIAAGFVALCCSMMVYSLADNIYVFYLGGVLLGVGMSWTTTTMVGYVINHWCKEHKGTIMGAVMASNGLGGAIAAQVISPFIESSAFGYRIAYRLTAVILLIVGMIVVGLFKDTPEGVTLQAKGEKKAKGEGWSGISLQECLRKPWFYVALVCVFLTGLTLQGSSGVYPAHMKDVGIDPAYVATVVSVHSLCLTLFKFLTGFSYDRFGLRATMLICDGAALVMIFLLANIQAGDNVSAMVVGSISSLALPLETIMLPLITAELVGNKDFARIMGLIVSINVAGYAVGAPLVNLFYDVQHTYKYILLVLLGVMALITIVFQLCLTAAHKTRRQIQLAETAE